jgi:hypothetical protein
VLGHAVLLGQDTATCTGTLPVTMTLPETDTDGDSGLPVAARTASNVPVMTPVVTDTGQGNLGCQCHAVLADI